MNACIKATSTSNTQAFTAFPGDIDAAIRAYEPGGLRRARELYVRSKEVSKALVYSNMTVTMPTNSNPPETLKIQAGQWVRARSMLVIPMEIRLAALP